MKLNGLSNLNPRTLKSHSDHIFHVRFLKKYKYKLKMPKNCFLPYNNYKGEIISLSLPVYLGIQIRQSVGWFAVNSKPETPDLKEFLVHLRST